MATGRPASRTPHGRQVYGDRDCWDEDRLCASWTAYASLCAQTGFSQQSAENPDRTDSCQITYAAGTIKKYKSTLSNNRLFIGRLCGILSLMVDVLIASSHASASEAWKLPGVHVENGCGASWTRWPH